MIDNVRLRGSASKFRRTLASKTSGTLAYTFFCLVTLLYAVCLDKMPDRIVERISDLRHFF